MDYYQYGERIDAMSQAEREGLSETLLTAFLSVKKLFHASGSVKPVAGSAADTLLSSDYKLSYSASPKFDVSVNVHYGAFSGIEHAIGFSRSLAQPDSTFHLSTVARGCLEAYARSWWLLSSSGPDDMLARWLSTVAKEMTIKLRLDPNLEYWSGARGRTRVSSALERVVADIAQLSSDGKPVPFDYTRVASGYGSTLSPHGREKYSELSGVAHGDPIALAGYFGEDESKTGYLLTLPRESGLELAEQVFYATAGMVRTLRAWKGEPNTSNDQWAVDLEAARAALLQARGTIDT